VRNAAAFLGDGHADCVDGVLFPHTCDSIQGLATLARDFELWRKPCFTFLHPKGESRPSSRKFLRAELESFQETLEQWTGHQATESELWGAIELHQEIDRARHALLIDRRRLPLTDRELYRLLRRGEWLWPSEHLAELRRALDTLVANDLYLDRVPVMITGYVPEPDAIFDVLDEAGGLVVADDYAAIGRRINVGGSLARAARSPLDALVERYFEAPPCSTRSANQLLRMNYLLQRFRDCRASGLLIHGIKFCEPELFDYPELRRRFSATGAPLLYVEGELELELSGQTTTRVEAFIELLREKRSAA
jgi:benzoyl-CoA reductase/2-hydroxyglutaryl-CoA dehydratase subunit BcrC/BadD/HgdB